MVTKSHEWIVIEGYWFYNTSDGEAIEMPDHLGEGCKSGAPVIDQ